MFFSKKLDNSDFFCYNVLNKCIEFILLIRGNIMRYSIQRKLIFNAVLENKVHPTADYIYNLLKKDYPDLSLGTVYRNLNIMAENNMLRKISIPNGSDRFDGTLNEHQHIVCTKCGKVIDILINDFDKICKLMNHKTGFIININSIVFEGICADCQKNYD